MVPARGPHVAASKTRARPAAQACLESHNSVPRLHRERAAPALRTLDTLARPPFGVRAGLAPLLIWGALIERRGEICLYERGTYVPTWSAEFYDRFLRAPEEFTVRCIGQSTLDEMLADLSDAIPAGGCGRTTRINDFLQRLFAWYRALPDYTRRTARISQEAKEFRHLLSSATDPLELLLRQLPEALGVGCFRKGVILRARKRGKDEDVICSDTDPRAAKEAPNNPAPALDLVKAEPAANSSPNREP